MESYKQIDCFKMNMFFWKIVGIWPGSPIFKYYKYYSITFILINFVMYLLLSTLNFGFLHFMDDIIEETLFYCTEINVILKVSSFIFQREKINNILQMLESEILQPQNEKEKIIIAKAKQFTVLYWKCFGGISVFCNSFHVLTYFVLHILFHVKLVLPVSSYAFIPEELRERIIYVVYFYQSIGMHFHMWISVNTDTFLVGLMVLVIAQLTILDDKLRNITDVSISKSEEMTSVTDKKSVDEEAIKNLNQSIKHFDAVAKLCNEIQEVFSVALFIQFGIASCLLCVCLFRFTLPITVPYYIFITTYISIMTAQIFVPCWFGAKLMDKSLQLSEAIYDCDWISGSKQFKSNLKIFTCRLQTPLIIKAGKFFDVGLTSFTSIIKSAYSFFALLRHMQSRESAVGE